MIDTFAPLSPADRKRWHQIKSKASKEPVSVPVDKKTMRRLRAVAESLGVTPDVLVKRGIQAVLAAIGDV